MSGTNRRTNVPPDALPHDANVASAGPAQQQLPRTVPSECVTECRIRRRTRRHAHSPGEPLPQLATVADVAEMLRTSTKAIYAMVDRGQLPGVVRVGRRLLFRREELVHWVDHKCAPSQGVLR